MFIDDDFLTKVKIKKKKREIVSYIWPFEIRTHKYLITKNLKEADIDGRYRFFLLALRFVCFFYLKIIPIFKYDCLLSIFVVSSFLIIKKFNRN